MPTDTVRTPKGGHMAQALRDATAQPSSPLNAGLYCFSQADGAELWIAWDGAHILGSQTVYPGEDIGPIVERLGKLAYGDDVEVWTRTSLSLIRCDAGEAGAAASPVLTALRSGTPPPAGRIAWATPLVLMR